MNEELIKLEIEELNDDMTQSEEITTVEYTEVEDDTLTEITEVNDAIVESEEVQTVEYIKVEDVEVAEIEIDEAVGWVGGDPTKHYSLEGRDEPDQHIIESITGLREELNTLGTAHNVYTSGSGIAEFRQWIKKDKPVRDVGYFVGLVQDDTLISGNNVFIDICDTDVTDVYGVTVGTSGICGNQDAEYWLLNEETHNKGSVFYSDPPYAKVCLLGTVEVRVSTDKDFRDISVGDYVVPNKDGCAIKSSNNVGFRVIEKKDYSTQDNAGKFVTIALVPQNDNVARVMKELEDTRLDMQNISFTIGNLNDKIDGIVDTNITINGKFDEIKDEVSGISGVVDTQNKIIEETRNVVNSSQENIEKLHSAYTDALTDITRAKDNANQALEDITAVKDSMTVLIENKDTIAGFFAEDSGSEANLGTLLQKVTDNGTGLTEVKQTINDNGALIENLALYVDRYSIGDYSPTFGLSYAESLGALSKGDFVYVPIGNRTENSPIYVCASRNDITAGDKYLFTIKNTTFLFTALESISEIQKIEFDSRVNELIINDAVMKVTIPKEFVEGALEWQFACEQSTEFTLGNVYVWSKDEFDNGKYYWREIPKADYKLFGTTAALTEEKNSGDLWYCADKYINADTTYEGKTLYLWSGKRWVAVAIVNDSNARSMSYIRQTEESITSTVTNMRGDISSIEQTVDSISSKIEDIDSGMLSEINQTAESIMMGIYEPTGSSSSLELLLSGLQSTAYHEGHLKVGNFQGKIEPVSGYYSHPPVWNDEKKIFEFDETHSSIDGEYYFNSNNHDYYCKKTGENSYEIYTRGNKAMANISTRVNDAESSIESWTNFESELNQAITSITQKSNEDAAEMVSMVFGEYKHVTAVSDALTDAEKGVIDKRYDVAPTWDIKTGKFVFDESQNPTSNGLYCIPVGSDSSYYWELVLNSENQVTGYKKYEMKASNYASLMQKVDEDSGEISLVAGNSQVEGGIFVKAINERTSATIIADRIALNGTTTFADALNPDKTAISGDYIKTGVITSNNYSGPVTYRMYGAKIGTDSKGNKIIATSTNLSDCIYYTPIVKGTISTSEEDFIYYYATSIQSNEVLSTEKQEGSVYIVSDQDFDPIPTSIETLGTKFDLNNGTIYSKNLSLDRGGNLTISGKISATSGWIGNEEGNGFEIASRKNNDKLEYYLGNNQISYNGETRLDGVSLGTAGVYVGPDGIGLGNGNFYVDNLGHITMKGNIVLDGSVSWSATSSPTQVLYACEKLNLPSGFYNTFPEEDNSGWHKIYIPSDDEWMSYTYDGGVSWTDAIKIQGNNNGTATTAIQGQITSNTASITQLSHYYDDLEDNIAEVQTNVGVGTAFVRLIAGTTKLKYVDGELVEDEENGKVLERSDIAEFLIGATNEGTTATIKADRIKLGDGVEASEDGSLAISRLYGTDSEGIFSSDGSKYYPGLYFLEVTSSIRDGGDLSMRRIIGNPSGEITTRRLYGFEYGAGNVAGTTSLNFVVLNKNNEEFEVWGVNNSTDPDTGGMWAKDIWHFDNAIVTGLGVVPVFG
jgi:methyl-accepting chemotaxis protein